MSTRVPVQITIAEVSETYKQFTEKFKPKKTTDDCYTPQNIFDVICEWVCEKYGVKTENIVRPFFPGGDYERYPYEPGAVVLDNPPFSIITQIVRFYNEANVSYFLFAPHLTNFSIAGGMECCHVIVGASITYANGAEISTSFVTNMADELVITVPELYRRITQVNKQNLKAQKKQVGKYEFPDYVLTSAKAGYFSVHGIEYKLRREDAYCIGTLDQMRTSGKSGIFGRGFLLSEKAAAEKAAAEKWQLSPREMRIVEELSK